MMINESQVTIPVEEGKSNQDLKQFMEEQQMYMHNNKNGGTNKMDNVVQQNINKNNKNFNTKNDNAEARKIDFKAITNSIIRDKLKFPETIATIYYDTESLARQVHNIMKNVFADWYGAKIEVYNYSIPLLKLYFTPREKVNNSKIYALELIDAGASNKNSPNRAIDMINKINRQANGISNLKSLKLSNDGKRFLSAMVPQQFINSANNDFNKIQWDKLTKEGYLKNTYDKDTIYFEVIVDLIKIIRIMYGDYSSNGGSWAYQVNIGAPINPIQQPNGPITATKWQLFILRTNSNDVSEIAAMYGFNFNSNNMNIITG